MLDKKIIYINGMSWGERELAQLIRRKMMSKEYKHAKKYTRKTKHTNKIKDINV